MNSAPSDFSLTTVPVLGCQIHGGRFSAAVALLMEWAGAKVTHSVSFNTVYTLMCAHDNMHILHALHNADLRTPDGMPIVWLQRRYGVHDAERIYGPDVMRAICQRTAPLGLRHYFLGTTEETLLALIVELQNLYPGLAVAGYSAPQVEFPPILDTDLLKELNDCRPDIVWVGLGSPKQDLWMQLMKPHLSPCLMLGVGAAFDFIAGTKKQAPVWMRRNGLEWLFRLMQEPRRLWRRYLIYNTRFLLYLAGLRQ